MSAAPQLYTAAQIASVLGVTARAVTLRTPSQPSGMVNVRGKATKAWSMAALPASMQQELERIAAERGCTIAQIVSAPVHPWQPPRPWHQIPQPFRDRAQKLCEALAPVLARQHELGSDLMSLAGVSYRQHFGQEIEERKLRYVMDRATKRDNSFCQWQRPELYLDEAAFHGEQSTCTEPTPRHQALDAIVSTLENRAEPRPSDRQHLFDRAFRHFESMVAMHPSSGEQLAIKRSLVAYLYQSVPGLYRPQSGSDAAKPLLAVRRAFNRLYTEWVSGGRKADAIKDERADKSGREGYRCDDCEKKIRGIAAHLRGDHGREGNVDLAVKLCLEKSELCALCEARRSRFPLTAGERVRMTPNAIEIAALKGPDAVRKIAPTHHCDWSDTEAGDRFVIDDATTNELAWDEQDGQIISGQVQYLATEDEFSAFPLQFYLYFGAPNSLTIKKAVTLVLTTTGLPHEALLTERGVFANRMLAGDRRAALNLIHFRELEAALSKYVRFEAIADEQLRALRANELGLRDPVFKLKIQQARSPQAKTIERSFYEFQKNASRLPGFAGFNQRFEKSRAMADFDRRVDAGKEHPGNEYLHLRELRKNYEQISAEIANRPINGVRHRGLSPRQVWEAALARRPIRKLPPEIEAVLHTHRLPKIKVHSQGIKVSLNRFEDAFYFGEHTGPLVGRSVAVRIDYDAPGFIHFEHPDTGKLLKVERALTKRRTATPEEIAKSNQLRRDHIKGARGEAGNMTPVIQSWIIRDSDHTAGDMAAGRTIAEATEQDREQEAERRKAIAKIKDAALERGDDPDAIKNPARYKQAVELEAAARAELAAQAKTNKAV
jgi:hypothetical protein